MDERYGYKGDYTKEPDWPEPAVIEVIRPETPNGEGKEAKPARKKSQGGPKPLWKKLLKPFIVIGLLLAKLKSVIFIILKLKFFITFLSMFISIAAYALIWGWVFAAGFVALLMVHEMGHWVVLRHQGVKTSPIVFIPFLGAAIGMREMPHNVYKEAQMALGGPILGSIGALVCLIAGLVTGSPMLQALAFVGFFLNLFNLMPVLPLDGGRAMAAVHPFFWLLGLVGLVGVIVVLHVWILLFFFVVFGLPELIRRWRDRHNKSYYSISRGHRLLIGAIYIGLALALVVGMKVSYLKRDVHHHGGAQVSMVQMPQEASVTLASKITRYS